MARSGSTNFNMTAGDLVTQAFKSAGILDAEQQLQSFEVADGMRVFNIMIKAFQAVDFHLWTNQEAIVFLVPGQKKYNLGALGDKATALDDFVGSTLTTDAAIGATALAIASTAGITANDEIGVELDDGTRQWTTVSSIDTLTALTLSDPLTSAASTSNTVFTFTNLLDRPVRMSSSRRKEYGIDSEIPMTKWSRSKYFNQVNKESHGTPVCWYYSPQLDQGEFYVWETPSSINTYARVTLSRALQNVDNVANDVDFPAEWYLGIVNYLAMLLGGSGYNIPEKKSAEIQAKATTFYNEVITFDEERGTFSIKPKRMR